MKIVKVSIPIEGLTLMLLLAKLANTKWCKKTHENDWNPGTWVFFWEYSTRDGFQKIHVSLCLGWKKPQHLKG